MASDSLSDMLQRDLTDFLMDIEADDNHADGYAENMKIEDTDTREDFTELEKKDFVEQEKIKLEESDLFREVMEVVEGRGKGVGSSQAVFDQVINCNQLITRIDQM